MERLLSKKAKPQGNLSASEHEEEAERNLVLSVEERKMRARQQGRWDAAVDGERPPLDRVPMNDSTLLPAIPQASNFMPEVFHGVAKHFNFSKAHKKTKSTRFNRKISSEEEIVQKRIDEKPDIFTSFRLEKVERSFSSHVDNLVDSAIMVNKMFDNNEFEKGMNEVPPFDAPSHSYGLESEPLLPITTPGADQYSFHYGLPASVTGQNRRKKETRPGNVGGTKSQFWCLPRSHFGLAEVVNPASFLQGLTRFLFASTLPFVILPSLLVAALLFYRLGNPSFRFLPGEATLSWWFVFMARQAFVLEIVRVIEFLAVEGIALRTRWMVFVCGPLVTLFFINAKGWPLIAMIWSLLDLGLLHGECPFQQHWLFFLRIELLSPSNPGGEILKSDLYLRVLLSVLLAGSAHAIKRTHVAMAFGRRICLTYRTQLEQILADIVLITEVAVLTTELEGFDGHASTFGFPVGGRWKHTLDLNYETTRQAKQVKNPAYFAGDIAESLPPRDYDSMASLDSEGKLSDYDEHDVANEDDDDSISIAIDDTDGGCGVKNGDLGTPNADGVVLSRGKTESLAAEMLVDERKRPFRFAGLADAVSICSSESTGQLKHMLDRWQEPQNKLEKHDDVSISDILKFKKALAFMDKPLLFGSAFGPCNTRDQVIKSARKIYRRLLRVTKRPILSYDVIQLLALDDQRDLDDRKNKALERLFRPDIRRELTLLAFVQTCDTVYKRLRFFRASVGNASVINNVLESIVDGFVNFFLALVIMTILKYNPYPVLVSLSTIMVSFAFAVGSSASKYIEGVLLIAFRRPFDIGDRIVIAQPGQDEASGISQSWFVEDINLWCTTLRFSMTNEVAVLNNGILSTLRIVNCNRSPNALISLNLEFDLKKIDEEKIAFFRQELEQFIRERPRIFDTLMVFRCDAIDISRELIQYSVRVRHMRSWQDAPVVLHTRGELLYFAVELGRKLGINKSQLPIQVATIGDASNTTYAANSADVIASIAGAVTTTGGIVTN